VEYKQEVKMALSPIDIGMGGAVALFAIDKIYSLAKNKGNSKRCIDHESSKIAMQNNAIIAGATVEMKAIMQKILESSIEQVILLRSLNGERK